MNGGWWFLIVLILLIVGGYGGWVVWSRANAKKNGLPPPSLNPFNRAASSGTANYPGPAPGGVRGWIESQIRKFQNRNNRYASGAYEEPSNYSAGRGRGAGHRLDPDEAWDARVGNEAYYEEQELGLHGPSSQGANPYGSNPYSSNSYGAPTSQMESEPARGRSRTREYDEEERLGGRENPFGDEHAAASLRGVSPRPLDYGQDTSYGGAASAPKVHAHKKAGSVNSVENSPTESRRSVFRENM